ncbi:hypothetical protein, partial [Klebsiella oxytoca]|uniref:hypothetical protein n=1 Tax=Klebsiella oxytoca TaxID=571 RepID=UPI0022484FF1
MINDKEHQGSLFRQFIWYSVTITLFLVIIGCLYWFLKDALGLPPFTLQMFLLYLAGSWFLLMWLSPFILQGWNALARAEALNKIYHPGPATHQQTLDANSHYLTELRQ